MLHRLRWTDVVGWRGIDRMLIRAVRDNQLLRDILSPRSAGDANDSITAFHKLFQYDDCTTDQLLALADLGQRGKDFGVARAALAHVVERGSKLQHAYYKLGRVEMAARDPAAATRNFQAGIDADPEFPHNWMGAARALRLLGDKAEASIHAERFATFHVPPHGKDDFEILGEFADALFTSGQRCRSKPIYELFHILRPFSPLVEVRLAEGHMAAGEFSAAQDILDPLRQGSLLDNWGVRSLAICRSQCGRHEDAIELAGLVARNEPSNKGFAETYLDVVVRARDMRELTRALKNQGHVLDHAAIVELHARVCLLTGDVHGALGRALEIPLSSRSRLYQVFLEIGYTALGAGSPEIALVIADHLSEVAPDDIFVDMLRIDAHFQEQDWQQAARILQQVSTADGENPHVLLKRFEFACFTANTEVATALWKELETAELPSKQFILPIFRFLAEQHLWDALVDRAVSWLDASFVYDQIGYVFFRAAKRTGRHVDFIRAIEALQGWMNHASLLQLHTNLVFDQSTTVMELDQLAVSKLAATDATLYRKLEIKRRVFARAAGDGARQALYLCTNGNYLCSTLVALHSAAKSLDCGETDYFVVVDDNLVTLASDCIAKFSELGMRVRIVPSSDVVDGSERLNSGYGLFTSGHTLASAAYYRIHFARNLRQAGKYSRAIYIDSDVLVRRSLGDLFATDMKGEPLAARVETLRPEVKRAIVLHRLLDNQYFNSGVLLFDLTHQDIEARLDATLGNIADETTTLLFHDQCALNLGFRGSFSSLYSDWNYPITQTSRISEISPTANVLHYLDRPKPWSAAYSGECSLLWYEAWMEMATLIGEDKAVEATRLSSD